MEWTERIWRGLRKRLSDKLMGILAEALEKALEKSPKIQINQTVMGGSPIMFMTPEDFLKLREADEGTVYVVSRKFSMSGGTITGGAEAETGPQDVGPGASSE